MFRGHIQGSKRGALDHDPGSTSGGAHHAPAILACNPTQEREMAAVFTPVRQRRVSTSIAALASLAAGLAMFAQTPAPPTPASGSPTVAPGGQAAGGAGPDQPPVGPGTPAGRGGGRGGRNPNASADFSPKPPVRAQSPADQARSFALPAGYQMELVVAEPETVTPAVIEFDGNGRMYVVDFTSYMLDADGNGAHDRI